MAKKKSNLGLFVGAGVLVLFAAAAVLFTLTQYEVKVLFSTTAVNGFKLTFGSDNSEGKLIFGVAFLFAILGAGVAALAAFKILKVKANVLFMVCALLALVSAIAYLVAYCQITADLKGDLGIDLNSLVTWAFAFWCGFALHVAALIGSVFGALKAR